MLQGKTFVILIIALVIGFGAGFVLRPVIVPVGGTTVAAAPVRVPARPVEARGIPYFAANLDEARRIVAGCRAGSVRGDECANAEQAVTETEGRNRFKKFMGH